jgi:rSAM/selenodomain-associated transferase 1
MKTFEILNPTTSSANFCELCALAVMTKAPEPGQVKTRLSPPLTPHEAAELNKCFLVDTGSAISRATKTSPACGVAVYTPPDAASVYVDILPTDFILLPQRGESFGERLYFAATDLFKCGFASVCLIDSDSPTVSAETFATAARRLNVDCDTVVLGPCEDGGYYLIGINKPHRELFERIDWSSERVLAQTMQRASEIGIKVKLLPQGYDVDDGAALRRLCVELLEQPTSELVAPNTRKILARIIAHKNL